uniref:Uncharacterized protein n=1 Tax=Pipistrellus kuhlii TaxID=59472 RepID=A0A7J7X0F4_PIPKU|nr:hypothetical protein mPipKuh1_010814 [Pipistrellus kuhlii]
MLEWGRLTENIARGEDIQGVSGTMPSGLSRLPRGQSRKTWSTPWKQSLCSGTTVTKQRFGVTPADGAVSPPRPHVATRSNTTGHLQGAAHLGAPPILHFSASHCHQETAQGPLLGRWRHRHTASRDTATGLRLV